MMINMFRVVIGLLLLVFGRRFYWLFISTIGFIAGVTIAQYVVHSPSIITEIIIAIVAGTLGIILANLIQRVAITIAGAIAGGYMLLGLLNLFNLQSDLPVLLFFLIGALLGLILITKVFDWTLIIFTSSVGALLVTQNLPWGQNHLLITGVFFLLLFIGVTVQYQFKRVTNRFNV